MNNMKDFKELESTIGYQFNNKDLLVNALTHSSYANEKHWVYSKNNERLEFLGDAVLELVSSDYIFHEHKTDMEGDMTKLRASLVCEQSLADSARQINLGEYIYFGKGEYATGGYKRDSILSDAFEAVIGSIYLDGGIDDATRFIKKYVLSDIEKKQLFHDSKTVLQEMVQGHGANPLSYELVGESGPDHDKQFEVSCKLNGKEIGSGKGKSKKAAEQRAAYEAILKLKSEKK